MIEHEKMLEIFREGGDEEYLEFDRIENKLSSRPDLHAFIVLNELIPSNRDIVCAAEHGRIWLDIDTEELAKLIDEPTVIDLIRCGVMAEDDCLTLFA